MPVTQGEAKEKVYSIIADSIDVLRFYESAIKLLKAEKDQSAELMDEADALRDENARLKDRCDVLERSFGDTAALEHTVTELQERNDGLRLRLGARNSETEKELGRQLQETLAELEKYKTAVSVIWHTVRNECAQEGCEGMIAAVVEAMKQEGYDIEEVEEFGSSGSEDNPEGQDEHDFL